MIDLRPVPVPELSLDWIDLRQSALVEALSQRRRRPMKWVALAGASGLAAAVATLVLIGGSPQSAFAGWSATPTPPTAGQLTSAVSDCQTGLARIPANLDKGPNPSSLVPELSDVRGPYTVTLFGDAAQDQVVCIASSTGNAALHWIAASTTPFSSGAIAVDQVSHLARDTAPYTLVVGRTGTGVTGVTLSLSDGSAVTATTGNGGFVAWWPGSQGITSAKVATPTGIMTQTLDLAGVGNADGNTVCMMNSCGGKGG